MTDPDRRSSVFGELPSANEAAIYASRARRLGLRFSALVELGPGTNPDRHAVRAGMFALSAGGQQTAYLAPEEEALAGLSHWLNRYPEARERLCVSTPTAIRAALRRVGDECYGREAVDRLAGNWAEYSARRVLTGSQTVAALAGIALVAFAAVTVPAATLIGLNVVGALFFLGVSALRFVAARLIGRRRAGPGGRVTFARGNDTELPVYTILVPLYHEAAVVGDLIASLDEIDWPRDRLDIKLLLEADDDATVAAVRAAVRGPPYELVLVPAVGPRTKPKALAYAMPFARGEFVTIYDAEDKPHPGQLRAAFARFQAAGPELACLQASLIIDNPADSWLARSFAIEYAALFDGLLPALADLRLPLPLGGTSNHFRRAALEATGGWDPYNVTEDADLGMRLARFGYRSSTLAVPTLEEAPAAFGPWLRQRTRWFKGWLQTWLVHTRHPVQLARQLGLRGLVGFNLIGTAIVVSSIIYPVYLGTLIALLADPRRFWGDSGLTALVGGINLINLCAGYLAMVALGGRALRLRGRGKEAKALVYLPLYWLLMSLASYRATVQLVLQPHRWEKTPHRRRRSGFRRVAVSRQPANINEVVADSSARSG